MTTLNHSQSPRALPEGIRAVLFDLDGTLLDTAADLYAALQALCAEQGRPAPDARAVRQRVSAGALALLALAFPDLDEAAQKALLPRYLELYRTNLLSVTRPFAGIEALLERIEQNGLRWGIVTNKAGFLTEAIVDGLGWRPRLSALVAGDTLPVKKPDPGTLLLGCEQAGVTPAAAVYVGDDTRDVAAGGAAGMYTVAVNWGYLGDTGELPGWGADAVLDTPLDLAEWLGL
ncbi:HAD family hydrolase [Frateuria aurantia]